MSLRPFLLAAAGVLVLASCNDDLDITAPYKENTIIYALLDKDSTTQYLRINKAFLGPGNAYEYAQVPDSSEYQDGQLQAEVQEVKNGTVVNTYALNDTLVPHDPGIFPGPMHKIYYFNAVLDSSATYRIEATAKGNHVSAETPIVAEVRPGTSTLYQPLRLIQPGGGYTTQILRWYTATNGKRYELAYRFNWDEVIGTDTVSRSFTQVLNTQVSTDLTGGVEMQADLAGEAFFQTVALRVGNNPDVSKRIFRGVDLIWSVAGPDLHLYLQLNSPISGIVEDRPTFSNVDNGLGLFSTRRFRILHKPAFDSYTAPELAQGQYTAGLNFCIPGSADFGCD
jgi:hypothetical protein